MTSSADVLLFEQPRLHDHEAAPRGGAAARRPAAMAWNETRTDYPRSATVHALFEVQAALAPDAIAAVHEGRALTYGALDRRADRLARRLRRRGVGPGVPVGVFVERSLPTLVALLAILKAGGAYVPMDPAYPDDRLRLMLRAVRAPILISRPDRAACLSFQGEVVSLEDEGSEEHEGDEDDRLRVGGADDIAYVMFTSGSTGVPKAVAVPHRGVVRLVMDTNYIELERRDRVLHASNLSFDAATFEIWGALLHGARLVLLPREALLAPAALHAAVRREGITVAFLTTALFHHLASAAPEALAALDVLLVGGDTLAPKSARAVLRHGGPRRLMNVYGPTENTTFSTAHLICDVPEDATSVPIGKPISNTQAYVLDGDLGPCPVGAPGDLYVGGDGLAWGYLGQPALTAERFIPDPFSTEPGRRLYRTGDRAIVLPDGSLDFVGRSDRQVKIRGFRIELGEVEAALLACPSVREAVAVVREDAPGDKRLLAYVVGQADAAALRETLAARLPGHMVPSSIVVLEALPLNPNGKVDLRALPDLSDACDGPEAPPPSVALRQRTATEERLAGIWADLLRVQSVRRRDSFFDLGGDSLLAARLLLRIHDAFRVEVPAELLFTSPTLAVLAERLDELRSGAAGAAASASFPVPEEALLDPSIRPSLGSVRPGGPSRQILLTGATGFLGAFLLRELLGRTGATIHCLVRAGCAAEGMRRIRWTLEKYGIWEPRHAARVVAIPGDLAMPLLGLAPAVFEGLAANIDAIYHSGAEISYVKPYLAHRDANVLGTREILRLACAGRVKPLHYLSTIAVFGPIGHFTGAEVVREDDDLDRCAGWLGADMGYAQSKWAAERLVAAARARGAPVTIFRPGFIVGDSATGAANLGDFIARLIKGCVEARCYPDLPRQSKQLVPVDYVSAAVAHISLDPGAWGRAYHLVPPAEDSLDLRGLFDQVKRAGYDLESLPYAAWVERVRAAAPRRPNDPLLPLIPMLSEKVHGGLTRWELYEGMPVYDDTNTRRALDGSGIACPPSGPALLRTYLGYLVQAGFLPAPERGVRAA